MFSGIYLFAAGLGGVIVGLALGFGGRPVAPQPEKTLVSELVPRLQAADYADMVIGQTMRLGSFATDGIRVRQMDRNRLLVTLGSVAQIAENPAQAHHRIEAFVADKTEYLVPANG